MNHSAKIIFEVSLDVLFKSAGIPASEIRQSSTPLQDKNETIPKTPSNVEKTNNLKSLFGLSGIIFTPATSFIKTNIFINN